MSVRILTGDCRELLPTLPAESVQCCVCSPPYYGLRDYGTALWDGGDAACDHVERSTRGDAGRPATLVPRGAGGALIPSGSSLPVDTPMQFRAICGKCGARRVDRQLGLEPSPDAYIAEMVAVFREVRRVLRDDGTCWVNMGDSYASGGQGRRDTGSGYLREGRTPAGVYMQRDVPLGCKVKDLLMMPARLALALQADGWWVRSDIIWAKPNPMPESCRDRCTSAHEHIFMLTKAPRYFFDADAIAEPASWAAKMPDGWDTGLGGHGTVHRNGREAGANNGASGSTRACRNVWTISTEAFPQSHFATFPTELAARCIRAGTSERGCCAHCGKPWVREIEATGVDYKSQEKLTDHGKADFARIQRLNGKDYEHANRGTNRWSPGCACNADVVPCTVLDPFAGAGTTLLVADRLQRNAVGIELNPEYVRMAEARIASDAPLFGTMLPPVADAEAIYDRQTDLFAAAAD